MINQSITFIYCATTFTGSLSTLTSKIDGLPLIFFRDFDGSNAWIAQSQAQIIKI
jgi:hypothetical protein